MQTAPAYSRFERLTTTTLSWATTVWLVAARLPRESLRWNLLRPLSRIRVRMAALLVSIAVVSWTPAFSPTCCLAEPPEQGSATESQRGTRQPNVLMIVVDDLGWADLGCYGSEFHLSPKIDQLAQQSVRFTQAYAAAPVCSPTRAALLTGKHPARLDMTIWHEGAVQGGRRDEALREAYSRPNLPLEEMTLAERFRDQGYATAHIGKWHLGTNAFYPENQGFDVNIGGAFWGAPATFFHPFRGYWSASNHEPRYVPGLGIGQPGDYLTDRLTDETIRLLTECRDRPFYIQLWYYSVHSPIEAPEQDVKRFRQRATGKFQTSPEYAAMIHRVDANVGRLLDQLESLGLSDQTVVILTSDNGGVDSDVRGIVPTSNHPLRAGKGTLYEGGLRVPLMIRWPGQAAATCATPVISEDLHATLVDAMELDEPTRGRGEVGGPRSHQDGLSLIRLLQTPKGRLPRNALYWHFPHYYTNATPCSAVRDNNWKLIHFYETDECELYDLSSDIGEAHNLAATDPDRTRQLRQQLDQWRANVGANGPTWNRKK